MGFTGKGIVVAVVDQGLEKYHPELQQNFVSFELLLIFLNLTFVNLKSVLDNIFRWTINNRILYVE